MTQEEITVKITEHDGQIKRHEGRIKQIENEQKTLRDLVTSVSVMAEQMRSMNEKMDTLTADVQNLKEKPAKRWEAVLLGVLKALGYIAPLGVLAYFVIKMGI